MNAMRPAAPRAVVLLAAGRGSRMGALTERVPKALLPLPGDTTGRTVLDLQLQAIQRRTTAEIVVVTGFGAEHVMPYLAERHGRRVRRVHNPDWADDDNLRSAACGVGVLSQPARGYLLVETDLLMDDAAWDFVFQRLAAEAGSLQFRIGTAPAGLLAVGPADVTEDRALRRLALQQGGRHRVDGPWVRHPDRLNARPVELPPGTAWRFKTWPELQAAGGHWLQPLPCAA